MRVKIGNTWYEPAPNRPIAIELDDQDLDLIAPPDGRPRLHHLGQCFFRKGTPREERQRVTTEWMARGARIPLAPADQQRGAAGVAHTEEGYWTLVRPGEDK